MLKQTEVDAQEEALRLRAAALPDAQRQAFYQKVKDQLKDPDTYAALNWFFVAGLHHFYLQQWLHGLLNILSFALGVALLFTSVWLTGIVLILLVSIYEFFQLFRAQIIVQDWNNQLMNRLLDSGDYLKQQADHL